MTPIGQTAAAWPSEREVADLVVMWIPTLRRRRSAAFRSGFEPTTSSVEGTSGSGLIIDGAPSSCSWWPSMDARATWKCKSQTQVARLDRLCLGHTG